MKLPEKLSPKLILLIGGGIAAVLIIGAVVVAFVLPAFGGSFEKLDADNPSVFHRDGLAVTYQGSGDPAYARLDSQPREPLTSGQIPDFWADAMAQLPSDLSLISPIYTIETRDAPNGRLIAEMSIPNGAEPLETLSLYAWSPDLNRWLFLSSQQDIVRDVITFTPTQATTYVAAMQKAPTQPGIGMVVEDGLVIDSAVAQSLSVIMPVGATLNADGTMSGSPPEISGQSVINTPVVTNAGGFVTYGDATTSAAALDALSALADPYNGVVLDFDVAPEDRQAFTTFVGQAAERLQGEGKSLSVVIHGTTLSAYDLTAIGQSANQIWWNPGADPTLYIEGSAVQNVLYSLVGEVDRRKLGLLVSSRTLDVSPAGSQAITLQDALDVFGEVSVIKGYMSDENTVVSGEQVPFRLTGPLEAMDYDAALGTNYVAYTASDNQTHYIYFSSAESVARRLEWATRYGLSAVAVDSGTDSLAVDGAMGGLSAFIASAPAAAPPENNIVWEVMGGEEGSTLSETSGDLQAIQYVWVAEDTPGEYTVRAAVEGQAASPRGEIKLNVVEPTPAPSNVFAPANPSDGQPAAAGPAPVVSAGAAAGGALEIGGQVRGAEYFGFMQSAGMRWAKFQIRGLGNTGEAAGAIQTAHAAGFKVLLSMLGDPNINFDAWTNYYGQVAALGPDAMEIWNEPNFSREWPENQLGGGPYVNLMLAPAYNAIKSANPNVMVVSGAPTPTGAFQGCSHLDWANLTGCDDNVWISDVAAAGGASYMDCVGVHYNAGATSPYATSGHPAGGHYSWYFTGMINQYSVVGRPLCFTELGYAVGPNLPQNFAWANDNTVEEQAQWLAEAATLGSQRGVRLIIVWNVGGFGGTGDGDPQGAYAIVRGGGCPACAALGSVMGVQ